MRNFGYFVVAFWYKENDVYLVCGNTTGSGGCPPGYVCLKDQGDK